LAAVTTPTEAPSDVTGRPLALRGVDLDRFFRPQRIAFVGATDTTGSQAAMNLRMLCSWADDEGVEVVPVNPRRDEVDGRRCYPSLREVPGDLDVVVVMVPAAAAVEVLEDAEAVGAPFAVLFPAGFAESGDDGADRQERVARLLAQGRLRVLGPNTTLGSFQRFSPGVGGDRIALITQSGHQGRPIYQAQDLGVGLSHWAPTGNEVDLETADFVAYFADQSDVGVIAAYVEGFADGRTLLLAADHAAERGVPIVVVKVGRTELGRSWARSHSGHLAGSDAVTSAALRQAGVIRVDALDELLDVSVLLARSSAPLADGIAIYSISGGTGAHAADLATAAGLSVPELSQVTQDRLHEHISPFLRVSNPIDSGGMPSMDEDAGRAIIDAILDDPAIGALVVPMPGSFSPLGEIMSRHLVEAAQRTDKLVCVVWGSPVGDEPAYRDVLLPSGLPVFRTVPNCLTALRAWSDHHAFLARRRSPFADAPREPSPAAATARDLLTDGTMTEHASKAVLAAYGVRVTRDVLCADPDAAVDAARGLDGPVVLKISSSHIAHKSDLGLVRVGVDGDEEVRAVAAELLAVAAEHAPPGAIDGLLVCELVTGGTETILGVVRDELFGPVVVFGLGGVAVEVYGDVTFRVPPFDRDEAHRMIREVRGLPLLTGARGAPPADLESLVDAVMTVQRLALDLHDDVIELDVNPLIAGPDGCVAVDALVVTRGANDET
jgi:acetate---CoA ligase (ADP-forming)